MINEKKIAVIVPAYNVEKHIIDTLKSMPSYVDLIVVVDDASIDNTGNIVSSFIKSGKSNIILLTNNTNSGVGASIVAGYNLCMIYDIDIMAVMAGDGQMDPDDLKNLIQPLIKGNADYVKGNRLSFPGAFSIIPFWRYAGIIILTILTKIATGIWNIRDSQCGYTAITNNLLKKLPLNKIYPRYGYPNDLLIKMSIFKARVEQVVVKPIYRGENSGINWKVALFGVPGVVLKSFCWKLMTQYNLLINYAQNKIKISSLERRS